MPRVARPALMATDPAAGTALRGQVWHPRCARCGHPATFGMMLSDGAGTGPWLCGPSLFLGRAGCRPNPSDPT